MKKLILNNWAVKVTSLVLAITLWYLIKKNVEPTPSLSDAMPIVQLQQPMQFQQVPPPAPIPTPAEKKEHARKKSPTP